MGGLRYLRRLIVALGMIVTNNMDDLLNQAFQSAITEAEASVDPSQKLSEFMAPSPRRPWLLGTRGVSIGLGSLGAACTVSVMGAFMLFGNVGSDSFISSNSPAAQDVRTLDFESDVENARGQFNSGGGNGAFTRYESGDAESGSESGSTATSQRKSSRKDRGAEPVSPVDPDDPIDATTSTSTTQPDGSSSSSTWNGQSTTTVSALTTTWQWPPPGPSITRPSTSQTSTTAQSTTSSDLTTTSRITTTTRRTTTTGTTVITSPSSTTSTSTSSTTSTTRNEPDTCTFTVFAGSSIAEAKAAIKAAGCLGTIVVLPTGASGIVGNVVGGNTQTVLTDASITIHGRVKVPAIVGMSRREASVALSLAGLQGNVSVEYVPAGDPNIGTVITQSPAGSTLASYSSSVSYKIAVQENPPAISD